MANWCWKCGRHGHRVVLYERAGVLYLRCRGADGEYFKRSLRHNDRERGKKQAEDLYEKIRNGRAPDDRLSVGKLVELYEREALPSQAETTRASNRTRGVMWVNYLGAGYDVRRLDLTVWNAFIRDRSSGVVDYKGQRVENAAERKPIRPRGVAADLVYLRHSMHLAMQVRRPDGAFLLERDPTYGFAIPQEHNPRRPVWTHAHYEAALEAAEDVDPWLRSLFVLVEGTGRRLGAVLRLTWSDWVPEFGRHGGLRWRTHGKQKQDQVTPVTATVRAEIERIRRIHPGVGEAPIFPPRDSSTWNELLRRAEKAAGLEHKERGAFHPLRRKFRSERRHLPLKDVMELGGWKDVRTVETCYTFPDLEGLVEAVETPRRLREVVR